MFERAENGDRAEDPKLGFSFSTNSHTNSKQPTQVFGKIDYCEELLFLEYSLTS
jgi:hypothetical protein